MATSHAGPSLIWRAHTPSEAEGNVFEQKRRKAGGHVALLEKRHEIFRFPYIFEVDRMFPVKVLAKGDYFLLPSGGYWR